MCQIFATLNSTLTSLARYGHRMTYSLLFFIHLSLSSLRQPHPQTQSSPLKPQPSLLFHAHADADDHFHADLSLTMVFFFFFFAVV